MGYVDKIFDEAVQVAKTSTYEHKIGAVLFQRNQIIRSECNSLGWLSYKETQFKKIREDYLHSASRHAELKVLNNLYKEFTRGKSLMVVRVKARGIIGSAKPCPVCIEAIQKAGITTLWYSNNQGTLVKLNPQKLDLSLWEKELPL